MLLLLLLLSSLSSKPCRLRRGCYCCVSLPHFYHDDTLPWQWRDGNVEFFFFLSLAPQYLDARTRPGAPPFTQIYTFSIVSILLQLHLFIRLSCDIGRPSPTRRLRENYCAAAIALINLISRSFPPSIGRCFHSVHQARNLLRLSEAMVERDIRHTLVQLVSVWRGDTVKTLDQ